MDAATAASSRLVGAIFVEKGIVTHEQLDHALELQEESGERLGEILVSEFAVSRLALANVLAEQWAEFERSSTKELEATAGEPNGPGDQRPVEPPPHRPIGEIFVKRGFVTPEAVERALELQRQTGQRIGEVLISEGSLTRLELANALAEQWSALKKLRPPAPADPGSWQGGDPSAERASTMPGVQADHHDAAKLEERIRAVERLAAAVPRSEDIEALSTQLREAIRSAELRIADIERQPEKPAPPAVIEALDVLRDQIEEPVRRVEAVEQRLGEMVPFSELERELEARLSGLGSRIDRIASTVVHAEELVEIRSLLDQLGTGEPAAPRHALEELSERLDQVSSQIADSESLVSLRAELDSLAGRPSADPELVSELESRVAALARHLEQVDPVMTQRLDGLSEQAEATGHGLTELRVRLDSLDALSARIDEIAAALPAGDAVGELRERLDDVASRLEEVASRAGGLDTTYVDEAIASLRTDFIALSRDPQAAVDGIEERIVSLERQISAEGVGVRDLMESVEEQRLRLERLAAELADRFVETQSVDELRSRIEELASRPSVDDEARMRLEAMALRLETMADEELRGEVAVLSERLENLSARPVADVELRTRVDELSDLLQEQGIVSAELLNGLRDSVAALERRSDEQRSEERLAGVEQVVEGIEDRVTAILREHANESGAVEELGAQVEAMAERFAHGDDLAELRSRLDELARQLTGGEELRSRVDDLAGQLQDATAAVAPIEALKEVIASLERRQETEANALDELRSRIEELASRPSVDDEARMRLEAMALRLETMADEELRGEVAVLSERLENLSARPVADVELRTRVDELSDLLQEEGIVSAAVEELGAQVEAMAERFAHGDDLAELRSRLDELEARLQESIDAATLDERLAGLEANVAETATRERAALEQVVEARLAELEGRLAGADELAALRSNVDALAVRPSIDEDARRSIGELAESVRDAAGEASVLRAEIESLVGRGGELESRLRTAEGNIAGLPSRDDLQSAVAEYGAPLREELAAFRKAVAERDVDLQERLGGFASARSVKALRAQSTELERRLRHVQDELATAHTESAERLDGLDLALRAEIASHEKQNAERSAADHAALAALETRVGGLARSLSDQDTRQAEVEAVIAERLQELAAQFGEEAAAARALLHEFERRLGEESALLDVRLSEVDARRSGDLQAAGALAAELSTRIDDAAVRAASTAAEIERDLRAEVERLASVIDEKEAEAIDALGAFREELGRTSASTAWRLERIEHALAADDGNELREAVAELARRLEVQQQQAEEQARQIERALCQGLASLGGRLAETQAVYREAGDALCRSIERLGAAVVEADERITARDEPTSLDTSTSYVAFAPHEDGYQMVEVEGLPPTVGSRVSVPTCEESLVVTRVGASPLPLDLRICVYLERT